MKRFTIHITWLSGESRASSKIGSKVALESRKIIWLVLLLRLWGEAGVEMPVRRAGGEGRVTAGSNQTPQIDSHSLLRGP